MAPARARALDDSRSETSSTIFNPKDKPSQPARVVSSVVKPKKNAGPTSNSMAKTTASAITAAGPAAAADPIQPHIDWTTMPASLLHTYRTAYRLPTQTSYTHPHADLIYQSSPTALRAPSAVLARRRLRDLKHQRRKAATATTSGTTKPKSKDKDKDTDTSSNSDRLLKPHTYLQKESSDATDIPSTSPDPSSTTEPLSHLAMAPEYIGKQSPMSLATAVRKHFNSQQLNEGEAIARFVYVSKQSRQSSGQVRTEGSAGDCSGSWIGSHGREVRRGEGGEVGFRLRFRP